MMNRTALQYIVSRHVGSDGMSETPIKGLKLFRIDHPIERLPGVYPASMCYIVQGTKRAYLGDTAYTYDEDHYLCATMDVPVVAEVLVASPAQPVLGILLDLDTRLMAETLIAYESATRLHCKTAYKDNGGPLGLMLAHTDDRFFDALGALLELLDEPVAQHVLAESRMRELLFALIEGEAGTLLRSTLHGAQDITRVITYLRDHLDEPLSVDELARKAGMSRAVFHRRFKSATSFSPLQFIKTLRLSHAAMQIAGGETINKAANAVGYVSASQFSREFRRQFGASPKQWSKTAASSAPDVQAASPI